MGIESFKTRVIKKQGFCILKKETLYKEKSLNSF